MIKIIYDPYNGHTLPDKNIDEYVHNIIPYVVNSIDLELVIGSELIISRLQLAILTQEIPTDQIQVWFENELLSHNEYGVFNKYPPGFCDTNVHLCETILTQLS
jgi:hypothetical protein